MKKLTILFGLFVLLFFASCKDKSVSKEIQVLPPQEFHDATAGNDVQLLDVRTAKEFEEGHLEHSVNIDVLEDDFSEKVKGLDKEQPVYLYCRSGKRSAAAAKKMKDLGFKEIYDMDGGYLNWESQRFETEL